MLATAIAMSGLVYIWAATRGLKAVVYVLKPGTMALIIAFAALRLPQSGSPLYAWLILGGLCLSVAGDIFLMLPQDRFVMGLSAFLLAHILYIAALWSVVPARLAGLEQGAAVLLLVFAALFYQQIARGIRVRRKGYLLGPVALYVGVISLMVWWAVSAYTYPQALPLRPAFAAAGALLFFASDGCLAWDRFVRPLPVRHLLVMGTYFAAQFCFALSI